MIFESGHRESNPDFLLGKQIGSHYIMAASVVSLFLLVSLCGETGLKSETLLLSLILEEKVK